MDEFLLLTRNKNYYMYLLNEDIIRLIYDFYYERQEKSWNKRYENLGENYNTYIELVIQYSDFNSYIDYYDKGYVYLNATRPPAYPGDDLKKTIKYCVYLRKGMTITSPMRTGDIIKYFAKNFKLH